MCDQCRIRLNCIRARTRHSPASRTRSPAQSRRDVIAAGAGLLAGTTVAHVAPGVARAQGAADAELARVQQGPADRAQRRHRAVARSEGRRLRVRRRADRGRKDPRGAAQYRGRRRTGCDCRRHQPHPYPRLCRHPQPFLSGAAAKLASPTALVDPDYNRDVQNKLDARLHPRRCLRRRADHRARLHRDGHDRDRRPLADQPHARAQRRLHQRVAGRRHPRGLRLFARRRAAMRMAAGHCAPAEDLFQLEGPAADPGARREPRCEGAGGRA